MIKLIYGILLLLILSSCVSIENRESRVDQPVKTAQISYSVCDTLRSTRDVRWIVYTASKEFFILNENKFYKWNIANGDVSLIENDVITLDNTCKFVIELGSVTKIETILYEIVMIK